MPKRSSGLLAGLTFPVLLVLPLACIPEQSPDVLPSNQGEGTAKTRHETIFTEILTDGYQGTQSCLTCHADRGQQVLASGHFKWQGTPTTIEGRENEPHGKNDLLNNFCIAIRSNEARCTQCHIGQGYKDKTFDFSTPAAIDCLVCHDQSGQYKKDPKKAGAPAEGVDLQAAAMSVGRPTRENCGACHFFAAGGDNVKHGDLSSDLIDPTRDMDVHMGGRDFQCQTCHATEEHRIAGMGIHSTNEGRLDCTDCHGDDNIHDHEVIDHHLETVACQSCHIPSIARGVPTMTEWYWSEAGQDVDPIPTDQYGKPLYDKMKGRFVWAKNVRPVLRWFNGKWNRKIVGVDDTYTNTPVVLAEPLGGADDSKAKLYPFKKMIGNQPADKSNKTILVPHLFGTTAGPNPYWAKFDWDKALAEGAAYAGQTYSGEYEFVDTVMYLRVDHGVAPKDKALDCEACHNGGIDFVALGFEGDPWKGDDRGDGGEDRDED